MRYFREYAQWDCMIFNFGDGSSKAMCSESGGVPILPPAQLYSPRDSWSPPSEPTRDCAYWRNCEPDPTSCAADPGSCSYGGGSEPMPADEDPAPSGIDPIWWQRLNANEKELCKADIVKCLLAYDNAIYATLWSRSETPNRSGDEDNLTDALRHARWQAGLTRDVGEYYAIAWGNAHEATNDPNNPSTCMDHHNNRVGREVGRDGGDINAGIRQALAGGRLRVAPSGCP